MGKTHPQLRPTKQGQNYIQQAVRPTPTQGDYPNIHYNPKSPQTEDTTNTKETQAIVQHGQQEIHL
jgi:hypothetical protein